MEQSHFLASEELLIIVITQILLFVALFVGLAKIGEQIKREYAKQTIVYQLNEAEYIKQKFERINDVFSHLLENRIFVDKVSDLLMDEYLTIGIEQKSIYLKEIQERNKNIIMKTSFYIDKDTKDLITEYLMSCATLTATAINWGNSLTIIRKVNGGGAFVHQDGTPVDIDYIKNRIPSYDKAFEEQRTNVDEYFTRIETALRKQLGVLS